MDEILAGLLNVEICNRVTDFANFLKDYVRQVKENGYDGIGEKDIDEKLKEFLGDT